MVYERGFKGRMEFQNTGQKYWHTILLPVIAISEKENVIAEMKEKNKRESEE